MAAEKGEIEKVEIASYSSKFQNLSREEKIGLISYFIDEFVKLREENLSISAKKDISIPIGVFDNEVLSSLEAIVKFLKEKSKIKFSKIGKMLNRSNKTIWTTYHNAIKKMPSQFSVVSKEILIPSSAFADRSFSTLESLVRFIKELDYSNHEVAQMLHLDDRTIWTIYDRVKKKRGMKT